MRCCKCVTYLLAFLGTQCTTIGSLHRPRVLLYVLLALALAALMVSLALYWDVWYRVCYHASDVMQSLFTARQGH